MGDLGLGFIPLCEKGPQWGWIQTLSVPPALLSGRGMESPPWAQTAVPCSWAGRVGSCGILHLQQTSRVDGCRVGGAATLQEHTAPFMEPGAAKVMAGGHRGAGQAWAQSLLCPGSSQPTRIHMHKHTALCKPKIHSQQPPTHLHTHASTHLHPLDIQLCILFQAEKSIPAALVLTLLLVPQTLWGILPAPCQRPGATQAVHTINPPHTHV